MVGLLSFSDSYNVKLTLLYASAKDKEGSGTSASWTDFSQSIDALLEEAALQSINKQFVSHTLRFFCLKSSPQGSLP